VNILDIEWKRIILARYVAVFAMIKRIQRIADGKKKERKILTGQPLSPTAER
jgi:hypothetical protein